MPQNNLIIVKEEIKVAIVFGSTITILHRNNSWIYSISPSSQTTLDSVTCQFTRWKTFVFFVTSVLHM